MRKYLTELKGVLQMRFTLRVKRTMPCRAQSRALARHGGAATRRHSGLFLLIAPCPAPNGSHCTGRSTAVSRLNTVAARDVKPLAPTHTMAEKATRAAVENLSCARSDQRSRLTMYSAIQRSGSALGPKQSSAATASAQSCCAVCLAAAIPRIFG